MDHSSELEDLQNENESLRRDLTEVENQRDRFMAEMMRYREKAARLESENERLQVTSFNLERSLRAARQESARLARATTTSDGRKALSTSTPATADSSKDHASASIVTQLPAPGPPGIKQEEVIDLTLDDAPDQQKHGVRRRPRTHSEGVGQQAISGTSSTGPSAACPSQLPSASSVSTLALQCHSSPPSSTAKSVRSDDFPTTTTTHDLPVPCPPVRSTVTPMLPQDNQPTAKLIEVQDKVSNAHTGNIPGPPRMLGVAKSPFMPVPNRPIGIGSPTDHKRHGTPVNSTEVPSGVRPRDSKRLKCETNTPTSSSDHSTVPSMPKGGVEGRVGRRSSDETESFSTSALQSSVSSCKRLAGDVGAADFASGDHPPSAKRIKVEQEVPGTIVSNEAAPRCENATRQLNSESSERSHDVLLDAGRSQPSVPVIEGSSTASPQSFSRPDIPESKQGISLPTVPVDGTRTAHSPGDRIASATSALGVISQSLSGSGQIRMVTARVMRQSDTASSVVSGSAQVPVNGHNLGASSSVAKEGMCRVPPPPVASSSGQGPTYSLRSPVQEHDVSAAKEGSNVNATDNNTPADAMHNFLRHFKTIHVTARSNPFLHHDLNKVCQVQRTRYTGTIYPSSGRLPEDKNRDLSEWCAFFLRCKFNCWSPLTPGMPGLMIAEDLGFAPGMTYPIFRRTPGKRWEYLGDYTVHHIGFLNMEEASRVELSKGFKDSCSMEVVQHLVNAFENCQDRGQILVLECQNYDEEFNSSLASLGELARILGTGSHPAARGSQGVSRGTPHYLTKGKVVARTETSTSSNNRSKLRPGWQFSDQVQAWLDVLEDFPVEDQYNMPISISRFKLLWPGIIEDQSSTTLCRSGPVSESTRVGPSTWHALFLQTEAHLWMPQAPGDIGLILVVDLELTRKETYSIFCLTDTSLVQYMGEYVVRHAGDLNESIYIPDDVQDLLASHLLQHQKYKYSADACKAVRTGEQVVHVLTLECTGFREELHDYLLDPDTYDNPHSDTDDGSEYEP